MPNLVGIGLSQVPTNSMLGGMAYQDPEHASIKDLDLKNLSQINSEISDTAVDVFVYDTRKDSDGGAWRKRTQHTSWYNETLNTSTRGSRREFPAVAVIVAQETTNQQVVIYDGDDPDLPMWMVFERGGNNDPFLDGSTPGASFLGNYPPTSVSAFNGIICAGCWRSAGALSNLNAGLRKFSFIEDSCIAFNNSNTYKIGDVISNRNVITMSQVALGGAIVNVNVRDVAMTVLPNAPIDDATGLPVPTIAVATDTGVSVIRDDGTVYDVIDGNGARKCYDVSFTKDHKLMHTGDLGGGSSHAPHVFVTNILTADRSEYDNNPDLYRWYSAQLNYPRINGGDTFATRVLDPVDVGGHHYAMADVGVSLIEDGTSSSYSNTDGMVTYITSDYNSGYQHGDIKGAFLSDTDTTDATYTTVADDWATTGSWTKQSSITISSTGSGTSGTLSITGNGTGSNVYFFNGISVEANTDYVVTVTFGAENANEFYINNTTYSTANKLLDINALSGLTRSGYFNSGSNTFLYIQGYQVSGTATTITSLVIQKVSERDRSVNNKGLQVFGTITKSAVATGAELVKYGGFSSSNALVQPYNSDMDWGTGDFYYMVWVYHRDHNGLHGIISRQTDGQSSGNRFQFQSDNDGKYDFYSGGSPSVQNNLGSAKLNVWSQLAFVRSGNTMSFYQDGISIRSWTDTANYTRSGANLRIGGLSLGSSIADNSYPADGVDFALFRAGGSAPSPEQIKKMYEDEKHLFQENSKATLYGSSDVVTALAYDDSTNLLHAGTSAGRSEFQGLRRINNTTTAVTTAISASNGLVAEQ